MYSTAVYCTTQVTTSVQIVSRLPTFSVALQDGDQDEPSRRDTTRIALDPYSMMPVALSDLNPVLETKSDQI